MIPAQYDESTASAAERKLFALLRDEAETADWVVLHSLGLVRRGKKPYGEIDFVLLIPNAGVICLEVKGGRVACREGVWETTDRFDRREVMKRSPFLQAREGMFALREFISAQAPPGCPSTLNYGYGVAMPDVEFEERSPEWEPWQVLDRRTLRNSIWRAMLRLAAEERKLHSGGDAGEPSPSTVAVLQNLLRPSFELVLSRGSQIEDTEATLLRLTHEQYDSLDLLGDNERCLFEGPAGTGKTLLAVEYARRCAASGKKTLLVCFNRLLGSWLQRQVAISGADLPWVAGSFYRLLRAEIVRSPLASEFQEAESKGQTQELYATIYPTFGRLALEDCKDQFDVIVVDEAQDLLRMGVLDVLDVWLKHGLRGGTWAIFGDLQRQAIFGGQTADEMRDLLHASTHSYARGRLTMNCRNTRNIAEETALLSGFDSPPYKLGQVLGLPVDYRYHDSPETQRRNLIDVLRKLLSDGVRPADIMVLSRLRMEHSVAGAISPDENLRLIDLDETPPAKSRTPIIRFATIQAFKGMESPVVVLCDLETLCGQDPQSLLYVGMSRARSQLTVLLNAKEKPYMADCIRRKLQEGWSQLP